MKQKLLLASIALLMSSCNVKTYYQIVDVKSNNVQKENNNYVYNDGVCKIIYNFWSEGGNAGFTIENLSEEILYVDLSNTFYIENGKAYDYYKARNYGLGKSFQIATGKSVGKSTGLSALATAYGIWRGGTMNGYPGSLSAQASSVISSQVSSSISEGSNSNLAYAEKPIIAIPPHASKSFSEYIIMEDVIQDCSVNLMVGKNKPEGMNLTESESPVNFRNYITYRKGENGEVKTVSNDFYVGGFTNYSSIDIVKTNKYGCKQTVTKTHCEGYASDRFYVKYDKSHSRAYSLDAIGTSQSLSKGSPNNMYYTVRKQ